MAVIVKITKNVWKWENLGGGGYHLAGLNVLFQSLTLSLKMFPECKQFYLRESRFSNSLLGRACPFSPSVSFTNCYGPLFPEFSGYTLGLGLCGQNIVEEHLNWIVFYINFSVRWNWGVKTPCNLTWSIDYCSCWPDKNLSFGHFLSRTFFQS